MIPDIDEGSPCELGDLFEGISLEEEKLDGLPLLGREPGVEPCRQLLAEDAFDGQLVKQRLFPMVGQPESCVFQFLVRIEVAGGKVPAPVEGAVVGDLEDPGTRCSARNIEQGGFTEDEKKNLLHQIVGFRFVAQDAVGDVANGPGVPTKKKRKSVFGSVTDLLQKQFVGDFRDLP